MMGFCTLSESRESLFPPLDPTSPGALPVCSLEPTSNFQAALNSGWGLLKGKSGKLPTSSMVLQILVFLPNLLATIHFSVSSFILSRFYSCSQSVSELKSFLEPVQWRLWDLKYMAILSSTTTITPPPRASLLPPIPLPPPHLPSGVICRSWGNSWLAYPGFRRSHTAKHFFLQRSIPTTWELVVCPKGDRWQIQFGGIMGYRLSWGPVVGFMKFSSRPDW